MKTEYQIPSKYDDEQRKAISLDKGYNLVLASPGCGKTEILAERIARAHSQGVDFGDMLCLTFTNRASREMSSRIKDRLGDNTDTSDLFVGNIHRFCSKFLFDNNLLPLSTSILDENDTYNILQNILSQDETLDISFNKRSQLNRIIYFQHFLYQKRLGHNPSVIPKYDECLSYVDKANYIYIDIERLCLYKGITESSDFVKFYDNIYKEDFKNYPDGLDQTLNLILAAKKYEDYKKGFSAIDYDELLIITYNILVNQEIGHKKYSWIQVDEVQDLNPLQIAIIDELSSKENQVVVYLGDEQQAIFSFIGAKLESLNLLKERCKGHLIHLNKNYRSPKYILDMLNSYANRNLDTDAEFLPKTDFNPKRNIEDMVIDSATNDVQTNRMAAERAIALASENETVAIIVNSNADAEFVGRELSEKGVEHFKISGIDTFCKPDMQMLISHFNVVLNDLDSIAWAKIFRQLNLFNKYSQSREFSKTIFDNLLTPVDLIKYNNSSMVNEIVKAFNNDFVIFDTETTGLDIFNDDIVQIAALKIKNGVLIDKFNVFLTTKKQLPELIGDIINPLLKEYEHATKLNRKDGLLAFLNFVDSLPVLGHNIEFDYRILQFNLKRDCGINDINTVISEYYDSLKLARLVLPNLRQYKLKALLEVLSLEGTNSHIADDDVMATFEVVKYCVDKAKKKLLSQQHFLASYASVIDKFKQLYADLFNHTVSILYKKKDNNGHPALVGELMHAYDYMLEKGLIEKNKKFDYIANFLEIEVIKVEKEQSLYEQLKNHIKELNTFRETDLCKSSSMKHQFFVSTVHKAKGLEFDNVIITNVIEGIYPFYKKYSLLYKKTNTEDIKEDARKLYVAMSRAKKRLHIITCQKRLVYSYVTDKTTSYETKPSRFIESVKEYFEEFDYPYNFSPATVSSLELLRSQAHSSPIPTKPKKPENINNKLLQEYDKITEAFRDKSIDSIDEIFNVFKSIKKKNPSYVLDYYKIGDEKYYRYDLYFHVLNAGFKYIPKKLIVRPALKAFFSTVFTGKKHSIETRYSKFLDGMKIDKPIPSEEQTSGIPDICKYLIVPFKESSLWQLVLLKELYHILPSDRKKYAPIFICSKDDINKINPKELEHLTLEKKAKLEEIARSNEILPNIKFHNKRKAQILFYYWKPKLGLVKVSYWVIKKGKTIKIKSVLKSVDVIYDKEYIDSDKIKFSAKETIRRLVEELTKSEGYFDFFKYSDLKYILANTWCLMKYGYSFELPDSLYGIYKGSNGSSLNRMQDINFIIDKLGSHYYSFEYESLKYKGKSFVEDLVHCLNEINNAYSTDDDYDFDYHRLSFRS